MKKITLLLVLLLFGSLTAQQLKSVYVLSEGGFTAGSSSLSLLDATSNSFTQSIFSPGNIGLYPDGLILDGNSIYLTEQGNFGGAGKVYLLDSLGTVLNSVEVGTNPYSLTKSNNKIYITSGPSSTVSVLNAADLSFVKDITVGVYPQNIISNEDYVFVANNSLWGGDSDSTVSVISSVTDELITTITVKLNPSSLLLTQDEHLLIGCPGDETTGMIYKISLSDFSKVDSFTVPTHGFGGNFALNNDGSKAYFVASFNDIIELDLENNSTERIVQPSEATFVYGYNYDAKNNVHYLLDAKDFSANGSLLTYSDDGSLLNNYETGVAPRRVVFHYSEAVTSLNEELISTRISLEPSK